jgi:hypothetical protein
MPLAESNAAKAIEKDPEPWKLTRLWALRDELLLGLIPWPGSAFNDP